ncbi:MAG: phenylalanine--tRNA ligase subunit beta [Pseudomonadota bacterium]|nr:phenylalanine--tRNA ligase subunit beta [Pseudomonadota bacterium]
MKFTLSALKTHLDTQASLDEIIKKLTAVGLEVESVADRARALAAFTVGHIKTAERHPNADRLQVCMVETASGTLQVVCGAPNARAGLRVAFAPPGAVIPATGTELKKGVIRGVESNGMLCSARELGLPDEADKGIMELPADAPVGVSVAAILGLDDPVIEINLTPNRADCASVRGIARDLAAAGLGTLKPLKFPALRNAFKNPVPVVLDLPAKACPMFALRLIKHVKNGPSPRWLQDQLTAVGLRPISALVDITNWLTLDLGRPLHVFDADKVKGGLKVRLAGAGETLAALNGKTYTLDNTMTVIADDSGVLSLGGIMGGESTGCTADTANVLVECALFDPVRTSLTGGKLEVNSDARYRFERGVDPASVLPGMEAATQLILDLCGGEASEVTVAGREPEWKRTYSLRPGRCASLGGLDVPADRQKQILETLGFSVTAGNPMQVTPPSWRADIQGEADLVEEVLRIQGYDSIPAVLPPRSVSITQPAINTVWKRALSVRRTLAARGMAESVTWSFMEGKTAALFAPGGAVDNSLRLANPISADLDTLRPSILPNLLTAAGRNAARGYPDTALFETGPAFRSGKPEDQTLVATGLRTGMNQPRHWAGKQRPVDALDAKADALAALEAAGLPPSVELQITRDTPAWYHPGRSGTLRLGPNILAWFGEIHPAVLTEMKIDSPTAGFEVFPEAIPVPKKKEGTAKPLADLPTLQPVVRDFAFILDRDMDADKLVRAVKGTDKALIRQVAVFDIYEGKGVPDGRKSLALSVTLQPVDKTLTDSDIEALSAKIVASAAKATGATLRE